MTILTHINDHYSVLVGPCPKRPHFSLLRVIWSSTPFARGMTLYARMCPDFEEAHRWFKGLSELVDEALDPIVEWYTEEDLEDYLDDLNDNQAMYGGMSIADLIDNEE